MNKSKTTSGKYYAVYFFRFWKTGVRRRFIDRRASLMDRPPLPKVEVSCYLGHRPLVWNNLGRELVPYLARYEAVYWMRRKRKGMTENFVQHIAREAERCVL